MAAGNFIGAQVGSTLAIRHGQRFIRSVFLIVASLLLGKLALDLIR